MKSLLLGGAAALGLATTASASAIIDNGFVQLGVDEFGQLNVDGGVPSPFDETLEVGLRHVPTGLEATAHGCVCEGWGVGIADALGNPIASGSANNDRGGPVNLDLVSFTSTASTARSVTRLLNDAGDMSLLEITHDFAPAAETPDLYRVNVTIENISGEVVPDLRYTRTFDWDIEPNTFDEVVTHAGVASTPAVLLAINNGFVDSDPFSTDRDEGFPGGTGDFVDLGPDDHGSNFDFGFGGLDVGESFEFSIFYGATRTEAAALAALGEVAAEVFSLGQPSSDPEGTGTGFIDEFEGEEEFAAFQLIEVDTATFIFGFAGVGGEVIIPDPTPDPSGEVPLPAGVWLLATGLGALGIKRAVRRKA